MEYRIGTLVTMCIAIVVIGESPESLTLIAVTASNLIAYCTI